MVVSAEDLAEIYSCLIDAVEKEKLKQVKDIILQVINNEHICFSTRTAILNITKNYSDLQEWCRLVSITREQIKKELKLSENAANLILNLKVSK